MTRVRSRGHRLARTAFFSTGMLALLLLVEAVLYVQLDKPGWLLLTGALTAAGFMACVVVTVLLYVTMFATWVGARRKL